MNAPRKRFGQNFLRDRHVIEGIVAAVAPRAGEHIVEIGPGRGAITEWLARSEAKLSLIEIDRDLAAALRGQPWWSDRIDLHQMDALKMRWAEFSPQPLRIVGNLPYNISTPLLFRLLDADARIQDMHLMLQKEVVDRLCARPATAAWGRLSIATQLRAEPEVLLNVGPECFWPAPKVDSQVVRLRPHHNPAPIPAILDELLRRAFAARRKTLRNALRGLISAPQWEALDIDPGLRAEVLHLEDWLRLASTAESGQT